MALNLVFAALFAAAMGAYPWSDEKTPDYDATRYWNAAELFRAPSYRANPYPESDVEGLKALLVKGRGPANTEAEFFCYYGRPEGPVPPNGFPGLVMVHGGGCTAYPAYVKDYVKMGFAVIALDWYNQRPAPGLTNAPPSAIHAVPLRPLDGGKRQNHIANVANIVLMHSLLRSFPEVNARRTVYAGLSWGSWYGGCVTAVDDRFAGAVFIYLADRKPWQPKVERDFAVGGRFLKARKVPAWWVVWPVDANGNPRTMQDAWEIAEGVGRFDGDTIVHNLGHGSQGFRYPSTQRMVKYYGGLAPRLPRLSPGELKDGVLTARILDAGAGVVQAKLWHTADDWSPVAKENYRRRFASVPATIAGDVVRAPVPAGTKLCWISAYEAEQPNAHLNDCCGSTGFFFPLTPNP